MLSILGAGIKSGDEILLICEGEEEENEEAKAIPASGVHRAKGADGREACTDGMHRKRAEILSIHGSRRVQPMDVSGDV